MSKETYSLTALTAIQKDILYLFCADCRHKFQFNSENSCPECGGKMLVATV